MNAKNHSTNRIYPTGYVRKCNEMKNGTEKVEFKNKMADVMDLSDKHKGDSKGCF